MRVISVKKLKDFWSNPGYRDSEQSLRSWYSEVKKGNWSDPHEIKRVYGTASLIGNERIVFNICGNKYRLIVAVKYEFKIFYIRFIGTHSQSMRSTQRRYNYENQNSPYPRKKGL